MVCMPGLKEEEKSVGLGKWGTGKQIIRVELSPGFMRPRGSFQTQPSGLLGS